MSSSYAVALDETRALIVERARLYRNLVVGVSSLCSVALLAAVFQGAAALCVLAALPAVVTWYAAADWRRVHRWRSRIVQQWETGHLRLPLFKDTLHHVPHLPEGTVAGLTDCLPNWDETLALHSRAPWREVQAKMGRLVERMLWLRAAGLTLAAAAALGFAASGDPRVLAALLAVGGIEVGTALLRRQRLRQWSRRLAADPAATTASDAWSGCYAALNLQGLPARAVRRWHALERFTSSAGPGVPNAPGHHPPPRPNPMPDAEALAPRRP